ncbi:MAG: exo-alpha-sialidase [Chlorobia bacterium]|nr:exo-alpha-sialidase [Fimbriimonadaceae bacterium]
MLAILAALAIQVAPGAVQVTPAGFEAAREPQVAIGPDERVYVAYGMGDAVYVSISTDQGASFGAPIKVGEPGKLSLGMRRGPRIVAGGKFIAITAVYGAQGKGRDGDVVAFRSSDLGKTWSAPVRVNDVEGSAREGLHGMALSPKGTIACAWLDLRDGKTKLYLSASETGGAKWSENRLVYASPSGSICECCHPSLAFDFTGKLQILFRNSLDGARDMYLATSTDLQAFSSAAKVGEGTWLLKACPMDGGMVAFAKPFMLTAWRRENEIYLCGANGKEAFLGKGQQPWIAVGGNRIYVVWQKGRGIMGTDLVTDPYRLSESGASPVVTASQKTVIAAWTENGIRAFRFPHTLPNP